MKQRLRFSLFSTLLFVGFSLLPVPSDPAIPDPQQPGSQKRALEDLARWAVGVPSRQGHVPVVTHRDLRAALAAKPQPQRHTLLPEGLAPEARRKFLSDLPFGSAMAVAAERHDVDGLLLAAVVEAESRFVPNAVSPRGAVGLMQVQPATGAMYGARNLSDPHVNLDVGSRYLRQLLRDYGGNLELALAAYNAGPAAVERYGGVPPFRETREYVKKVMRLYERHQRSLGDSALPRAGV
ncbi:MAG TPA: lytic transglycosylase domain-containing protein [Thermoanaerobaculia bacterium]|nr:lytic transglycosylase domain-containing protein [Thermoanaerobaculia bacterium]